MEKKDYTAPALRIAPVRYEYSFLATGTGEDMTWEEDTGW